MAIEISRIDHIGVAAPDLAAHVSLLEGLFGFRREGTWEDERGGYRAVRYEVPGGTGLRWEVMAPTGEGSALRAFLDSPRGPGLHHLAIEVPDVAAAVEELRGQGIEAVRGEGDAWNEAAIDAEQGGEGFSFHLFGPGERSVELDAREASDDSEPALGVIAVDHICHGFRDREELRDWYARVFGLREIWRTPDGEHDDFADLVLEIPGQTPGRGMVWEIIMPIGDDSFIQRFLDGRGPGAHHVALQVADWDAAIAACEHHEAPLIEQNEGETDGGRWRDAFLHPKFTGGVLTQFFWEEKPATWIRSDKIRPPGWQE
jgi:catechol 2,3-dioxygenase-like lactoylglutathione lyase family enzyme